MLEMQDHVERRKGRVAVAALPSICSGMLPALVRAFEARWPGIQVVIHDVTNSQCLDLLRARQADLALCASPSPGHDLATEQLGADTFHFVCLDSHPLARRTRLAVDDLLGLPLIVFDKSSSIRQHLDACIYPRQWRADREVRHLATAAGLVGAGLGVTVVPTIALSQFDRLELRAVPVDLPINERGICLVRRRDGEDSTAARAFVALLKESPLIGGDFAADSVADPHAARSGLRSQGGG